MFRSSAGVMISAIQSRFYTSFCKGLFRRLGPQKFHFGKNVTLPFYILAFVNDVPFLQRGKGSMTYTAELASSCDLQRPVSTGSKQGFPQQVLSNKSHLIQSYIHPQPYIQVFNFLLKPNVSSLPFNREIQSSTVIESLKLQNWK